MRAVAIQIPNFFPEKTVQELTSREVRNHFPEVVQKDQEIKAILTQVFEETQGNIPKTLRILPERIHDPVMLAVIVYNVSQSVTRDIYDQGIAMELPVLLKEATASGAHMAMQHMSADPEANENPGIPDITAPDDPVYYG